MSKVKYLIENGNNIFPVYETSNGMVLVIHDKIDVDSPLEIRERHESAWNIINQLDLREILMDLLP